MNLKLYYHMTPGNGWRDIAEDKLEKMVSSGLWSEWKSINFCIHYNESAFDSFRTKWGDDHRVKFIYHSDSVRPFGEQYSNKTLKLDTDSSNEKSIIFRFHLKGLNHYKTATWPANAAINELIDKNLILRWREVLDKFNQGYEAVGTYWVKQPWPHFKGNVWWATSDYIKRLPLLKMPHENNFQQQITGGGWLVHDAESWVGVSNPKAYDMYRETDQIGDHPDL